MAVPVGVFLCAPSPFELQEDTAVRICDLARSAGSPYEGPQRPSRWNGRDQQQSSLQRDFPQREWHFQAVAGKQMVALERVPLDASVGDGSYRLYGCEEESSPHL